MLLAVQWTSGWAGTQPDTGMPCLTERETEDEYCFLPETNSSPLKMGGWKTIVSFRGPADFQGRTVSFRECSQDEICSNLDTNVECLKMRYTRNCQSTRVFWLIMIFVYNES